MAWYLYFVGCAMAHCLWHDAESISHSPVVRALCRILIVLVWPLFVPLAKISNKGAET